MGAALGAGALTLALGYAVIVGLAWRQGVAPEAALQLFEVAPPPEPQRKRPQPRHVRQSRPEGQASPPNLRAEPTQIVAPPPQIPTPPPPVAAAPIAGVGAQASAGSAEVAGPGYGAGGEGNGRGSGGRGDGDGAGGDETPPRWVRGDLRDSDYPEAAAEAGAGGTVGVRYTVWTDGRVTECTVTDSSGNAELDATTCRLIRERFRFRPSRDDRGRPVPAIIVESHSWILQREPAAPQTQTVRRRRWF